MAIGVPSLFPRWAGCGYNSGSPLRYCVFEDLVSSTCTIGGAVADLDLYFLPFYVSFSPVMIWFVLA